MLDKTVYICTLSQDIQEQIREDLFIIFDIEFVDYIDTKDKNIQIAMNGRISDLEDIININKYI